MRNKWSGTGKIRSREGIKGYRSNSEFRKIYRGSFGI